MDGIVQLETTPNHAYRYNGKELDEISKTYEYGFRYYDPSIGKFTGVDPIADQFTWVSPFNYAENEPIGHIDLWGLQKTAQDVYLQAQLTQPSKVNGSKTFFSREKALKTGEYLATLTGEDRHFDDLFYAYEESGDLFTAGLYAAHREKMRTGGSISSMGIGSRTSKGRSKINDLRKQYPSIKLSNAELALIKGGASYRATFFAANPTLKGKVWVHHAIEQQVLKKYPGRFTEMEIHALDNLRGIPKTINSDIHLSKIRKEWNAFYKDHPKATRQQIINKADEIDDMFGKQFTPALNKK